MSSFLVLDPRPVYFTSTGAIAAGGSLKFFMAGTTTPQDVYSDEALSTNIGAVLTLGSDGRTTTDVWGDASLTYRMQLFDSNGALQFDVDNISIAGGASKQIPDLVNGDFLTNDGTGLLWATIPTLPDPAGNDGKFVSISGGAYVLVDSPVAAGEKSQNVTAATTTAIDFSAGVAVNLTHGTDITTLTFSNVPASGNVAVLTIRRVKDNSATARAISWPTSVKWPGGTDPSLTLTANALDVFALLTVDGGVTWDGSYVLNVA